MTDDRFYVKEEIYIYGDFYNVAVPLSRLSGAIVILVIPVDPCRAILYDSMDLVSSGVYFGVVWLHKSDGNSEPV